MKGVKGAKEEEGRGLRARRRYIARSCNVNVRERKVTRGRPG